MEEVRIITRNVRQDRRPEIRAENRLIIASGNLHCNSLRSLLLGHTATHTQEFKTL
jgi:hypothetical protein